MCPITQVDSTSHQKLWNTMFGWCINFDLIKGFRNVITTLSANGALVSRCFTETKSQTPSKELSMTGTGVDPHGWEFGSGSYRLIFFFQLHLWRLDTVAPQRGRVKCLKMFCPHLCELSRAVPQHSSSDIVWAVVFWGLMFSSRPQQAP